VPITENKDERVGPQGASHPDSSSVFDIEATKEIFSQLKKINDALPGAHHSLLSIVENSGGTPSRPRNYATYQEIMRMVASGVTVYSTSKRLKIPYSTCHAYTKMTPEQVAKLKAASAPAEEAAPVVAAAPPEPPEQAKPAKQAKAAHAGRPPASAKAAPAKPKK
jgi:hypothetical protein